MGPATCLRQPDHAQRECACACTLWFSSNSICTPFGDAIKDDGYDSSTVIVNWDGYSVPSQGPSHSWTQAAKELFTYLILIFTGRNTLRCNSRSPGNKRMRRRCQIKWNSAAWLISKVKQYPRKGRICHHVLVGRDQTAQYLIM